MIFHVQVTEETAQVVEADSNPQMNSDGSLEFARDQRLVAHFCEDGWIYWLELPGPEQVDVR